MSDKVELGKSGYRDFQSALDSVGADAMEQAIDTAFKQLMAEGGEESSGTKPEAEESISSIPGSMLKQLSIEAMEQVVAEAFSGATGERYRCAIKGIYFDAAENVQFNLTLTVASKQ